MQHKKLPTVTIPHWARWHVSPHAQGQIVEVATATLDDGDVIERVTDRSDMSVAYYLDGERVRVVEED